MTPCSASTACVAPPIGTPPLRHCNVGVGRPETLTDSIAMLPCAAATATGCVTIAAGKMFSTRKVALGPAAGARLPATSRAVPAANAIAISPSPVVSEIVTVRVTPVPATVTRPAAALPVAVTVTSAAVSVLVTAWLSAYVTVKLTGPLSVFPVDGAPIVTVGASVSTTSSAFVANAPTVPAAMAGRVNVAALPAVSVTVPPFNSSAFVAAWLRSSDVSPAWTVYWKTSVAVPLPRT